MYLPFFYFNGFYFEFQQLYSQWQESKDLNTGQWRLRKCNPYFIRPRRRCNGQLLIY